MPQIIITKTFKYTSSDLKEIAVLITLNNGIISKVFGSLRPKRGRILNKDPESWIELIEQVKYLLNAGTPAKDIWKKWTSECNKHHIIITHQPK